MLAMVEGRARVTGAGRDWRVPGDRMDVLEKSPPHCLYVPGGTSGQGVAETDCTIA